MERAQDGMDVLDGDAVGIEQLVGLARACEA
jgi:hypothetical protein